MQPSIQHHHKPCPQCHIPFSDHFQGWRFHHCPQQPVPVPDHPSSEEIFPNIQANVIFGSARLTSSTWSRTGYFQQGFLRRVRASSACVGLWEARLPTVLPRTTVTLHATQSSEISSGLHSHVTPGFLTGLFSSKQPFVLKQTAPNTPVIRTSSEGYYAFLDKCSAVIVDKSFHFPFYFFLNPPVSPA